MFGLDAALIHVSRPTDVHTSAIFYVLTGDNRFARHSSLKRLAVHDDQRNGYAAPQRSGDLRRRYSLPDEIEQLARSCWYFASSSVMPGTGNPDRQTSQKAVTIVAKNFQLVAGVFSSTVTDLPVRWIDDFHSVGVTGIDMRREKYLF